MADAGTEPKKHQSVELIDNPIEVTEHHRVEQACVDCGKAHHCPLPDDIRRAGLVEPKMTALIGWLKGVCHMSIGKIKKYSHDVIGVELSRGLIQKLVGKVSQSLADPYQQLLDAISTQSHLNVDETGHKDNEFCIAHLIRDLKFLCVHRDPANQIYGERLREQFRKLFKTIARRKEFVSEATFRRSLERIRNEIVWDATGEQPDTQHAANMAKRFYEHFEDYFRFISDPDIGPTNNLAEQAIRFVAIHRRMTQGTRGETGQSWFERICTVVVTCEQQGRSVLKFLTESVAQFQHGEPAPSLVPSMCDSS